MNKINIYLFKNTFKYISINTLLISILILFINSLEVSRIIENQNIKFLDFLYLSILKLPSIISEIIPFVVIVSVAFLYKNLISNNELISIRNVGFSIFDIFKPVAFSIFIFGSLILIILNPLAAKFNKEFSEITKLDNIDIYRIKFNDGGMWIKNTYDNSNKFFINIAKMNLDNMKAKDIKIIKIENDKIELITAGYGRIENNLFILNNTKISEINTERYLNVKTYNLKLNFDEKDILDSIINYKFVPYYKYKGHVNNSKKFNLYSPEVPLFYIKEIIKPLLLVIIGFLVMSFSGKFKRNENFFKVLFISIFIGFLFVLYEAIIINFTIKYNINYFIAYFIIFFTPLLLGIYQSINIEAE